MKPTDAMAMLVRWREFQESLAEADFLRSDSAHATARRGVDTARDAAESVAVHRGRLQGEGQLDLEHLRALAVMEQRAWTQVEARERQLAQAAQVRANALDRQLAARTQTKVANTRHDRLAAVAESAQEKAIYDRMADMHTAHRWGKP